MRLWVGRECCCLVLEPVSCTRMESGPGQDSPAPPLEGFLDDSCNVCAAIALGPIRQDVDYTGQQRVRVLRLRRAGRHPDGQQHEDE